MARRSRETSNIPAVTPDVGVDDVATPQTTVAMEESHFHNVIRVIKRNHTAAAQIQNLAEKRLDEIGERCDPSEAVVGCPDGSDNVNVGSIREWMQRVTADDGEAIVQLQAMQATAAAVEGK